MGLRLWRSAVVFTAFVCIITIYLFLVYNEEFPEFSPDLTQTVFSLGMKDNRLVSRCQENNTECIRFFEMMKSWPPDKPKAAIYILTRAGRGARLKNLLWTVDIHFTRLWQYPVIIFHSKMIRNSLPMIRNWTKSNIFFQEIEFKIPDFLPPIMEWPYPHCKKAIGYKHMCRFQSKLVTEQPIIEQLDYMWRLDDDSSVRNPVEFDVFRFMRDKDIYYGYMCRYPDFPDCVFGLWNATRKYIEMKHIKPTFFYQMPELMTYYNNFEISKVSLWTSLEYKDYIEYIDKLGGIYYYRWGDAPIKTIAVSLFVPENRTHHFRRVGYFHRGCVNKPPPKHLWTSD